MKHLTICSLAIVAAVACSILGATSPVHAAADFPEKGRPISIIIGFAPGSNTDVGARLLAVPLEKELGVPVQVINKPGAGTQTAMTFLATAKPDGYTIGYNPFVSLATAYLDPQRQAVFTADSFEALAMHIVDPNGFAVAAESPYKNMTDIVEAARANPEKIKMSDFGVGGGGHLASLELQRLTSTKFNLVHFNGGAPAITAMMGGHVDAYSGSVGAMVPQVRSGQLRVLGVVDKVESKFLPGVKTLEAQGIPLFVTSGRGLILPAGCNRDVFNKLAAVAKKIMESEEHKKAIFETGQEVRYMDPAQTKAYWVDVERQLKPMMEAMAKETK